MKKSTIFWYIILIVILGFISKYVQVINLLVLAGLIGTYISMNIVVLIAWLINKNYITHVGSERFLITYWVLIIPINKLNKFLDNL